MLLAIGVRNAAQECDICVRAVSGTRLQSTLSDIQTVTMAGSKRGDLNPLAWVRQHVRTRATTTSTQNNYQTTESKQYQKYPLRGNKT